MNLTTLNKQELNMLFLERHNAYMKASKGFTLGTQKSPEHIEAKNQLDLVIEEMKRRRNPIDRAE
jgi:hypothetical protein